ncbi:MAG: amidohydrolase [Clostridia bacterium]|nr:amidohydrolase [Clostridia bacterium]
MIRIQNGILHTVECGSFEVGYVDVENGKIVGFGALADAPACSGEIFDAESGFILPGMIDAHSHIGISEEGVRWEGEDCNETTNPVTPDMRVMDGFYPFDIAIPKARRAGITTVNACPGSTNVIGGQTAAVKLYGKNISDMVIKTPAAMKCAMGENPKRNFGESGGSTPMTRMAIAAIFRKTMIEANRYLAKKEKGEDVYDAKYEALIPLLKREIPMHVHAHRSDDILTALRLAEEFNLRCVTVHTTGGAPIIDEIARAGIMPIVGPCIGPAGKPETVGGNLAMCAALEKAGVEFALTTDHDVCALWMLPYFASLAVREGLSEQAAFRAITLNGAKVTGIDDRVGSIKVGKDADIVVYSGHPFHYLTKTKAVFMDGVRVD